jgi:2-keto-4-pentenoate hydratase/2-oxohepta-3-ene-1,7-dioic acid hydratase in catechol pathway
LLVQPLAEQAFSPVRDIVPASTLTTPYRDNRRLIGHSSTLRAEIKESRMKLVRYLKNGKPVAGVIKGDGIVALSELGIAQETILAVIEGGPSVIEAINAALPAASLDVKLEGASLFAPIERPGKYLAIGMNYGKHLEEADKLGVARSSHQIWFNKQTTSICGPFDDIEPGATKKLDYEVELGLVIGRAAKNVSETDALDHVFGYFVANDVSARDFQFHSTTMTMGKSFDTHGPIGPWIITADEIADPQELDLKCFVNGEQRQSSNTSGMIANIRQQIAYLSSAFTLEPGDLIATGTPEGVGIGMEPQAFLQPGDVVRCEIEAIGAIENRVAG